MAIIQKVMTESEIKEKNDSLLFGVRRSVRYHQRRRMFFDRLNIFTSAISVMFGSSTILAILNQSPKFAAGAAAIVTIFATIDLVVGTAKAARLHSDLSKQFIALERKMISASTITEKNLKQFEAERLDIESDEPPVLKVLDSICHNELMRAMGYPKEELLKIGFIQRNISQLFDFRDHTIIKSS